MTAVRGQVLNYWRRISLLYPEPGIRLIRQDDIGAFNLQLTTLKGELIEAVEQLETHYGELRAASRVPHQRRFLEIEQHTFQALRKRVSQILGETLGMPDEP